MMKHAGLYLHIPYCAKKCCYCDFPSWAGRLGTARPYTARMLEEMREKAGSRVIDTLYIGGGTPSMLPPALMEELLTGARRCFEFSPDAECSSEANPGAISDRMLNVMAGGGINRLSLGAQACQERLLSMLGRIHTWADVEQAVQNARARGIGNINLDLMFSLPGQTLADWKETLEAALALKPQHLSCYALIPEEGTPMKDALDRGERKLPSDELDREMYELCRKMTAEAGMVQYEISNFALPGYECRHNTDCWKRREYIGIGCSACGFTDGVRYRNADTLDGYLAGEAPQEERIAPRDAMFESVMLGLRMTEGVSDALFREDHGISLREAFKEKLDGPVREGLAVWEDGHYRLTRRGMDVQNRVLVQLMDD
ncbi:MAG: coproporphyrinogen III oxidase [Clostridiales bacterium]|nr:coproporphyrinogen III oxidase [Clostridiales bacterium]